MLGLKETILTKLSSDSKFVHGEYNVFVLTVKDYFKLYPSSYVQKAEITKVITGNDSMTDEEIMLSQTYGLYETEGGTFVMGTRGRNFLKPNHSYLVFCEKDYKEASQIIQGIIDEGIISNTHLRMLVNQVQVHQNKDKSHDIKFRMNGNWSGGVAVYVEPENKEITC
jgi:hypothetical protein